MSKKNLLASPLGFTLIELLISIVIVVILSSIGIASFNSANARNGVQQRASEIRSLARKLRTDAGAAVKPVTGATTANSCKAVPGDADQVDKGTVYGTYINFTHNSANYTYGVACYDSGGSWLGSTTNASLPSPFTFTVISGYGTIIFPFNGMAGSLNHAVPLIGDFTTVTMFPTNPQYVQIKDVPTNTYQIYFNSNGLICEQKTTTPPICAN